MLPLVAACCVQLAVVAAQDSCPADSLAAGASQAYLQKFDKLSLTYFDGRGLAEVPRTLLVLSGRFPGKGFEDVRLTRDQFNEKKGSGDLAKNLNRVPILNHNGEVIGQSAAISRYLAKVFGFMGSSDAEAAQIDAMCEHIVDIKAAFRKVVPYHKKLTDDETKEAMKVWFDTPAAPAIEGRKERQLQWFLNQLEPALVGDGFAVGGRPSLADAYLFNMLAEHAPELDAKGEPFGNLSATASALEGYPKLLAVVEGFKRNPSMQHYLATRGKMGF